MAELSIMEKISFSTARIECKSNDGILSTGTGFFVNAWHNEQENMDTTILMTNKHVIEGAIEGRLVFSTAKEGKLNERVFYDVLVDNFEGRWVRHPDPDVDLCCLYMQPFEKEAISQGIELYIGELSYHLLPSLSDIEEFDVMEDVVMVGYPKGLWDKHNNRPLVRRGVTATQPSLDYEGKKVFLIDAACFPGSSGSPVFIKRVNTKHGASVPHSKRLLLSGVLFQGPMHIIAGDVKVRVENYRQVPYVAHSIPVHLGYVLKAERIRELIDIVKVMHGPTI